MMNSIGADGGSRSVRKRRSQAACLCTCLSVFCAFSVGAEELISAPEIAAESVIVSQETQRADLRRALASDLDRGAGKTRQRLSLEEREALHRDLRDAMRNVNADHDAVERRQR